MHRGRVKCDPQDTVNSSGPGESAISTKILLVVSLMLFSIRVDDTVGARISKKIIRIPLYEHFSLDLFTEMIDFNEDCLIITRNEVKNWEDN